MEKLITPYDCHIFVCTNNRQGARKSCADGNSPAVRLAIKEGIARRGWKGKVRVSQCGCMGLCQKGPNVMLYPQKIWFSGVAETDTEAILQKVESLLKTRGQEEGKDKKSSIAP